MLNHLEHFPIGIRNTLYRPSRSTLGDEIFDVENTRQIILEMKQEVVVGNYL
jgi:hypothetical protein